MLTDTRFNYIKSVLSTLEDYSEVHAIDLMINKKKRKWGKKKKREEEERQRKTALGLPKGTPETASQPVVTHIPEPLLWYKKYTPSQVVAMNCEFVNVFKYKNGFEIQ